MTLKKRDRIVYIDSLRILATIAVVIIHVTAVMIRNSEMGSLSWKVSMVCNSCTRWCIPLFFMISGCCFLNRERELSVREIIKKYVFRLMVILIIFGLFYYFFDLWIYNQTIDLTRILLAPFSVISGHTGYHLWYLYDMILIYLMIPILQKIINHADKKLVEYFFIIFFIIELLFTYFNLLVSYTPVLSEILKINFEFPDLIGYIGCFIGGYYISYYEISKRIKSIVYVVGGGGIIVMSLGNWILSKMQGEYVYVFADYNGLFSVILAVALFLLLKDNEKNLRESKFAGEIKRIGKDTFGIYLVHVIFVSIIFYKMPVDIIRHNGIITIVATPLVVLATSYFFVQIVKCIPILKKYL